MDEASVDPLGMVEQDPTVHHYVRILTATEVLAYRDGDLIPEQSGPHRLGVVPLVHVPFLPYADPEHGLWAAPGLEGAMAHVDSIHAMIRAVGNRYGEPRLAVKGATVGDDADVLKFGRIISGLPEGGDVFYVEPTMAGINALLAAAQAAREAIKETIPEFLFTEAGAGSSGTALSLRATQFRSKMREVRSRWYRGLARVTEYAVAIAGQRAWDPDTIDLRVTSGPILPPDIEAELRALALARSDGGLKRADYVRHLQRLGIVGSEHDPEEYAAEVFDERADTATRFFGGGPPTPPRPEEDE